MPDARTALDNADWRRRTHALYAEVRWISETSPARAHALWKRTRDDMFANHPATPLLTMDRDEFEGLPVSPYDPAWRFELLLHRDRDEERIEVETGTDGVVPFDLLGSVRIPSIGSWIGGELNVWRLASYGGGLFVPVKDALSREPDGTYGGGRYLLDTVKGADLGENEGADGERALVIDFNFAYNPSCAYDPDWACPLAPSGNVLAVDVPVGERIRS